jgi:hypothetical protein
MDPEKQAVLKNAGRDIVVNLLKLFAALCVIAFFWGGSTTRSWMVAFLGGTIAGMSGAPASTAAIVSADKPPLKLLGHGCRRESTYQVCEGEVRNETDQRLDSVMAEVRFTDQAGTFVKSGNAMINYQPLMPGQTSSFMVMTTDNPQIRHFSIGFREMFGGKLKASR